MYTLVNKLSDNPINCSVGYNNSWLNVENNANRELFAQASYVTNFDDLSINLSAADVNIGNIHIADSTTGLHADVANIGPGSGALRVLTQDLESKDDDVTIGDKGGKNFATINSSYSALNVYPVVNNAGFTRCETRTSGSPSFISKQILIHNTANDDVFVNLTLTSGTSCNIPIGKNSSANHILVLDLQVLTINNYGGCSITFFS
jgi:hypothetical protein